MPIPKYHELFFPLLKLLGDGKERHATVLAEEMARAVNLSEEERTMKQANKGVFITTSAFSKGAYDCAEQVPQKVILVDGQRLAELMIEHDVGVATKNTYQLKRIDSDYFATS